MSKGNKTPQKNKDPNSSSPLTPVRYLDSPIQQSPTSHDSNLATCRTRLESLVKQLQDNYAKWKLAQQRGTSICYAIEAKKTKCLENGASTSYTDDLILPCNKLAIVASIFGDIAIKTKEILRQLRALCKLPGAAADTIYYKSWKLPQFVAFTKELSDRYEKEAVIKQRVAENIAHSTDRSELIAHTTFWEFPEYVDSYVQFGFLILSEEVTFKQ